MFVYSFKCNSDSKMILKHNDVLFTLDYYYYYFFYLNSFDYKDVVCKYSMYSISFR